MSIIENKIGIAKFEDTNKRTNFPESSKNPLKRLERMKTGLKCSCGSYSENE